MLTLLRNKLVLSLAGAALALALAGPAAAGALYRWTAEDGTVSFTDDPKRIPERHRGGAQALPSQGGLGGYARLTPEDSALRRSYEDRLQARLERLRELNAEPVVAALPAAPGARGPEAVVVLNDATSVRIPAMAAEGDEPIVVEEVRVKRPGRLITVHDTVVRQGERILMVVRPDQPLNASPSDFIEEDELLGR
jgi:hypothetical protein